jgi:alginate O-acetyltransferase complex protein AlgI
MLLVGYHYLSRRIDYFPTQLAQLLTFLLVVIGWVFFRATDMSMAGELLATMFTTQSGVIPQDAAKFSLVIAIAAVLARWAPNSWEYHQGFQPSPVRMAAPGLALGMALALIAGSRGSPFLYFQF